MPSVSERLRKHLERVEVQKRQREIERREKEKKKREELELALSLNKEAIRLIQPEKILSEININLLKRRGKIVKKEGVLVHNHFKEEWSGSGRGAYEYERSYPNTHAFSSVSLLWKTKDHCYRLMIAIGGDNAESRNGGIYWSYGKKESGYPNALNSWCEEYKARYPPRVSLSINIQNLEDSEKLEAVREQIDNGIETLYFELKKGFDTKDIFP